MSSYDDENNSGSRAEAFEDNQAGDNIANPSSGGEPTSDPDQPDLSGEYPEQKHAGKVGIGPNFKSGASASEKIKGLGQEAFGKIKGDSELAQQGRDLRTGELARREREEDQQNDPFSDNAQQQPPSQEEEEPSRGSSGGEYPREENDEVYTGEPEKDKRVGEESTDLGVNA